MCYGGGGGGMACCPERHRCCPPARLPQKITHKTGTHIHVLAGLELEGRKVAPDLEVLHPHADNGGRRHDQPRQPRGAGREARLPPLP